MRYVHRFVVFVTCFWCASGFAQEDFRRGDADHDGIVGTVIDVMAASPFAAPYACDAAADANGDGVINVADQVEIFSYAIGQGTLMGPGPDCGPDPTTFLTCVAPCPTPGPMTPDPNDILRLTDEFAQTGQEVAVEVLYTHDEDTSGYSFAVRHDPTRLQLLEIELGAALGPTADQFFFYLEPLPDGWFVFAVTNQITVDLIPGTDQQLFVARYEALAPGVTPVWFADDLGSPPVLPRTGLGNGVGPPTGRIPTTVDGSVSIDTEPFFRRGDVNRDSVVDIADAIWIFSNLFGASSLPFPCQDAADANDDQNLNIADGVFILGYLFTPPMPLADPGPVCGVDPTLDSFEACNYDACP